MDELIAAAAAATGMPESMVKRSAAARAKAQGTTVEAVLAEWAGVPVPEGAASAAPAGEAAASEAVEATEDSGPGFEVEVKGDAPPAAKESAPAAEEPRVEPADELLVPAGAVPRWLAALFVVVPAVALAYLAFFPNGPNCGDAGLLAIDPVSGEAVNCDGSAFGSSDKDFFAIGQEIYVSAGCTACHGATGGGAGTFPAFTGGALLTTFPGGYCSDQTEWIRLGSIGWPEETYGAPGKPVGGSGSAMPGFASTLSDEELASVALYERVAFGGEDLETAQADCFAPADITAGG